MTIDYCDPSGDILKQWNSDEANHHESIDDAVRQPANPGTGTKISVAQGDENDIDSFNMTTLTDVSSVSQIKLWMNGIRSSAAGSCYIDIYIGGVWKGYTTCVLTTSQAWYSKTVAGSWTQTDLNNMQIRIKAASSFGKFDLHRVFEMYCEITYTEVSAGFIHKINGMTPAKFNGMETTNAKILGIG